MKAAILELNYNCILKKMADIRTRFMIVQIQLYLFLFRKEKFHTLINHVNLPANIVSVLMRVGGTRFSGECWVEAPIFFQHKKQISYIPFVPDVQKESDSNPWEIPGYKCDCENIY